MNKERLLGTIRHLLGLVAGYFVGRGVVDEATAQTIIAALVAIIPLVWSYFSPEKRPDAVEVVKDAERTGVIEK